MTDVGYQFITLTFTSMYSTMGVRHRVARVCQQLRRLVLFYFEVATYICVKGIRCNDVLKAVEILLSSYRLRKILYLRRN